MYTICILLVYRLLHVLCGCTTVGCCNTETQILFGSKCTFMMEDAQTAYNPQARYPSHRYQLAIRSGDKRMLTDLRP